MQVKRLGKAIAKYESFDDQLLKSFLNWNALLTSHAENVLNQILGRFFQKFPVQQLSDFRFQEVPLIDVSGRTKHRDTLFEKLKRSTFADLSRIRDVSGLRIDCEFVRSEQFKLAEFIMEEFEQRGDGIKCRLVDRIAEPGAGYRALHIEVACPAGYIEIQVRSGLQYQWANTYEYLGDVFGREIRYQRSTDENLQMLQDEMARISDEFNGFEIAIDAIVASTRDIEQMWFQSRYAGRSDLQESMRMTVLEARERLDQLMIDRRRLVDSMERMRSLGATKE